MKKLFQNSFWLAALLAAVAVRAQNPGASQQADAWRFHEQLAAPGAGTNAAPEFYDSESGDVGPQIFLHRNPRRQWLQAFADEQMFYTDNVFLANNGRRSANVLVSTIEAALAPTQLKFQDGTIAPRLGYEHQWFSYGLLGDDTFETFSFNPAGTTTNSLSRFDFNVQTIFSDVTWEKAGWDFSAGLDFRRFLDSGNYDEFYRELVARWGVHRRVQLSANTSVILGYEGDYRFTETQNPFPRNPDNYNDRTDQSLVLIGSWQLCAHAIVQPFYRLQYSYYPAVQNQREDWLNSFGIALWFPITQNIALRTFLSYETLDTDGSLAQKYTKFDAGGGVNLSIRF